MRFVSSAAVVLASVSSLGAGLDKPKPYSNYDVQRCALKALSHAPEHRTSRRFVRKGEKSTGYPPIVAFEILESGEVTNAFVKRSSGFANVDNYAVGSRNQIQQAPRLRCH